MKKIFQLLLAFAVTFSFLACEKSSSDIASSSSTSSTGAGSTTGGAGSGTGGGTTGGSGTGSTGGSGFSAGFNINVKDVYNVFENNPVKLESTGTGIVSYVWRFGDGRKSSESNPVITYPMHGYYTISLTVTDANGKTETLSKDLGILCNFYGGSGNH
jgi:hypothetical protein